MEWQYEPRCFVVETDDDGEPLRSFTPDFYLPDEDLYIEITTMNQKLVTKKNRKVRQLRDLYPDVRIKVFYQRDYLHLVVKYGLDEDALETDEPSPTPTRRPGPPQIKRLTDAAGSF